MAHTDDAPLMLSISGCRGIVGRSFTPETVTRFVGALSAWLKEQGVGRPVVALGCDGRRGGDQLRAAAAAALSAAACRVIDLGVVATPTMGVMVRALEAHAGLTLTASHNPGEWNGLKVITGIGAAPAPDDATRIIDLFNSGIHAYATAERFGSVEHDDTGPRTHARRTIDALAAVTDIDAVRARRFTVALDSVNASGAEAGRLLLEELGCGLIPLNADGSGIFPHTPEPTEENLRSVCHEVRARAADIGFAQDPDADRLAVIDAQGRYLGEEYTLALATMALLSFMGDKARGAAVAANLSTSRMVDDVAATYGAKVVRAAVGEANVVRAMQRSRAVIGGEGNGGVIWPAVTLIRDSLSAMALILALMTARSQTIAEIADSIPRYAIEKRKISHTGGKIRLIDSSPFGHDVPGAVADKQDGLRLDFPAPGGVGHAWFHIRASNTEPVIRIIAEAPTPDEAAYLIEFASTYISKG